MKTLRKLFLAFKIINLELSFYMRNEVLMVVFDPLTRASMLTSQDVLFNEIIRLKRKYHGQA